MAEKKKPAAKKPAAKKPAAKKPPAKTPTKPGTRATTKPRNPAAKERASTAPPKKAATKPKKDPLPYAPKPPPAPVVVKKRGFFSRLFGRRQ